MKKELIKTVITRMENYNNPLIKETTNYYEHGNHRIKRPRSAFLHKEEFMD